MNYSEVKNPRWNIDRTQIICDVNFDVLGEVPFSAGENETTAHGIEIYLRCVNGDFGTIAEYVPSADEGPQPIPDKTPVIEGVQTL